MTKQDIINAAPAEELPRRCYTNKWIFEEKLIQLAVDAVEEMGAHPLLTDAVILLGRARNKVADFVDLPNPELPKHEP